MQDIAHGDAHHLPPERRGWIFGHFGDGPTHSDELEVKWAEHPAGTFRQEAVANQRARSLSILVRGRFRFTFGARPATQDITLERPGTWVTWGPRILHSWAALEDSTVLTVRWPSLPEDQVPGPS